MIDIYEGVREFLLADADVVAMLEGGIYVGEIDGAEIDLMPRRTAIITQAGGMDNNSFLQVGSPRMEIWCYGESYFDAAKLDRMICAAMAAMCRKKVNDVLLHTAARSGGPWSARDAETNWPVVHRSYTVTAAEVAAS
jgi:hypothetical protein